MHLQTIYRAGNWTRSYSGFTATKHFMSHVIAVVALQRDSTNRIPWIVTDLSTKREYYGRSDTVLKAKSVAGSCAYRIAKKYADNTRL